MLWSLHCEATGERLPRLAKQLLQPLLNFSGRVRSTKGLQEPRPQAAAGLPPPQQTTYSAFQQALGGQPFRALCLGLIPQLSCRTNIRGKIQPLSGLSIREQVRAEPPLFQCTQSSASLLQLTKLAVTVWNWLGSGYTACFYTKCIAVILTALFYSDFKQQETFACLSTLLTRSLNLYLMRGLVFLWAAHCHIPNQMCQAKY